MQQKKLDLDCEDVFDWLEGKLSDRKKVQLCAAQRQPMKTVPTLVVVASFFSFISMEVRESLAFCNSKKIILFFLFCFLKVDLDPANYECFLDIKLTRDNNITTRKIYQVSLLPFDVFFLFLSRCALCLLLFYCYGCLQFVIEKDRRG